MVHFIYNIEFEIVLVLLKGNYHLREIARILKKPHATVMRKLNFLAEKNILDCKKEGKNSVFFIKKNLSSRHFIYQAEHYKLIKLIENYPDLSIILDDIQKNIKSDLIILFGSYSKYSANRESDIDIYIESKDKSLNNELKKINSKINGKIGLFDKNSLLIKEIIKNHVLLKGVEKFYERTGFFE